MLHNICEACQWVSHTHPTGTGHSGKEGPLDTLAETYKTSTFVPGPIPGVLQPKKKVLLRIIT